MPLLLSRGAILPTKIMYSWKKASASTSNPAQSLPEAPNKQYLPDSPSPISCKENAPTRTCTLRVGAFCLLLQINIPCHHEIFLISQELMPILYPQLISQDPVD